MRFNMIKIFLKSLSMPLALLTILGIVARCANSSSQQQNSVQDVVAQGNVDSSDTQGNSLNNSGNNAGGGNPAANNAAANNSAAINSVEDSVGSEDSVTNSSGLNGAVLNGAALNGSTSNGAVVNGNVVNQAEVNGAAVNQAVVNGVGKTPSDFSVPPDLATSAPGTLNWVGYNYKGNDRQLEIQIVTSGSPSFHMFQEVNRKGQSELIVRFLNTSLRKKVRRDIDATEFRSPVSYIRMRTDQNFHHTDVVMTLRDAAQPRVVTNGSSLMFLFSIPEHWFAPKSNEVPVASAEIVDGEGSGFGSSGSSVPAAKSRAAYVPNPGDDEFGKLSREKGVPLVPKSDSSKELVPQSSDPVAPVVPSGEDLLENAKSHFNEFTYVVKSVAQGQFAQEVPAATADSGSSALLEDDTMGAAGATPVAATESPVESGDIVPVGLATSGAISTKKVVRLEFRSAPISQIVGLIARESGINFIISPKAGDIRASISLKNIAWDLALKALLDSNRLGMQEITPNLVRIDFLDTFTADHLSESAARQASAALVPIKVLVMALSYAKATEAATMITAMLPKPTDPTNIAEIRNFNRFKVQADVRSNSVIVEATPAVLSTVKLLLERLDIATPQVRIASRLVEMTSDLSDGLGFTWGTPFNVDPGRGLGFGTLPFPNYMASKFSVDPGGAEVQGGTAAFRFGSINNIVALDLKLRMYEIQKKAETLQTQEVMVQDLEKALISAGSSDFFQLAPSAPGMSPTIAEVTYNLSLSVTPHITADGVVQMLLDITGDSPLGTSAGGALSAKSSRKLTTTLLKRSGETAVIGGLYAAEKSKTTYGIPYLSHIPIIGALFRSTDNKDVKKDLLIMVTPTIVGTSLSAAGDGGAGSIPAEAMPTVTPVAPAVTPVVPAALEAPNSSNVARAQTQNQAVQQQQQGAQQSQAAPANDAEPVSDSQQSY